MIYIREADELRGNCLQPQGLLLCISCLHHAVKLETNDGNLGSAVYVLYIFFVRRSIKRFKGNLNIGDYIEESKPCRIH